MFFASAGVWYIYIYVPCHPTLTHGAHSGASNGSAHDRDSGGGRQSITCSRKCASCLVIESRGTAPTRIYKSTEASSCKLPEGEAAFATTQEVYIQYICLYFINYII